MDSGLRALGSMLVKMTVDKTCWRAICLVFGSKANETIDSAEGPSVLAWPKPSWERAAARLWRFIRGASKGWK